MGGILLFGNHRGEQTFLEVDDFSKEKNCSVVDTRPVSNYCLNKSLKKVKS